jgi:SAM-dependent methyltransferase
MARVKDKMILDGHLGGYVAGGDPATWCPALWRWTIQELGIRSVLDVGCGEGHSARFFQDAGCEVLGVEGCGSAIENSAIPDAVVQHDFTRGPFVPPRRFDLAWSCEFLEHVEHRYVPNILAALAHAAKAILVTHAFPGQTDGHHHVNCRPGAYWIQRIEGLGFVCDVKRSRAARTVTLQDYPGINHFARSGLVFIRDRPLTCGAEAGASGFCQAVVKSWRINWGFRLSAPYRAQRRRRRLARRALRQAA